jgi:hypothetical protein
MIPIIFVNIVALIYYSFYKKILPSIDVRGEDLKNVHWGIIKTEKKQIN